jgi:mannose-6-phosphate isomerase-like protein (cupin superfamily)
MAVERITKIWGREIILHNDAYCAKLLQYDGVRTSSQHYHEKKHETFVVLSGTFEIDWYMLDSPGVCGSASHGPGACLVFEPRTVHRVKCVTADGGVIVEASSHDDPEDCVRLEPSINPFGQE